MKFNEYNDRFRRIYFGNYSIFFVKEYENKYSMRFVRGNSNFGHDDWEFRNRKDFLKRKNDMLEMCHKLLYNKKEFVLKKIFGE
jgi:hypothetical protein